MSNPDEIRAQIDQTRGNLSSDVNALTDKVSPGNAARRQVDKARGAATGVRERVMGAATSAGASTKSVADSAADTVGNAPGTVSAQARGNPIAAGVIALGAGWLLGSMLPSTAQETKAAAAVKDNAGALAEPLKEAAQEAAAELKPAAQQAADAVKTSATDAAATVKDEGTSTAVDLKDQAQDAKETVQSSRG